MTAYSQTSSGYGMFDQVSAPPARSDRLSPVVWTIHFVLFVTMMMCVVLPDIAGVSSGVMVIRHTAYTSYTVLMFTVGVFCSLHFRRLDVLYLTCAAVVSLGAMTTVFILPSVRYIDYAGPASFLLGVHVSTIVLPRVFRDSAESILLPATVVITAVVCLGFYFHAGPSLEQNNTVAAYTGLTTLLLAIRGLRRGTSLLLRTLCWGGAAALAIVLITSLGRTSIFACAGTGVLLVWLGSTSRRKVVVAVLLLLVIAGILWTDVGSSLFEWILSKGQSWERRQTTLVSLSGRLDIWTTGLRFSGFTWLGHGIMWITQTTGKGAHSSYLTLYFAYGFLA